jgi:peptidyl-prolyl cis-trans isomerase D
MLDFMRRHAQSWMIKVALGAVVVVFVFWGIWNPNAGRERDLVKINGQTISIVEAKNYYQRLRENYQSIYRDMFTEEMVKKMGLKERAVRDLVNKVLLLQEARHLGLTATAGEVQAAIQEIPAFQKDGTFDPATYLRALQGARINAKEFEANQKQMLLLSKIQRLIVSSAKVSDPEVLDYYRAIFEKVNLEVLSLDPADIRDVSVTPDEVKGILCQAPGGFQDSRPGSGLNIFCLTRRIMRSRSRSLPKRRRTITRITRRSIPNPNGSRCATSSSRRK